MKMTRLLFIVFTIIVAESFAQTDGAAYYCQGCCSGVGAYYLKLDSKNEFELYYLVENRSQDNSVFSVGTYSIKEDVLILTSKNISQGGVVSRKINDSDSLIIHFYAMDNVRGDSVTLINAKLKSGKSFFYHSALGTIRSKFNKTETLTFSSLGFDDTVCSFTESGEYEIVVKLNPEGKTKLKKGHEMKFKRNSRNNVEWFEGVDDKSLKFTTKSCR